MGEKYEWKVKNEKEKLLSIIDVSNVKAEMYPISNAEKEQLRDANEHVNNFAVMKRPNGLSGLK
jgi:hypothetical protein